MTNPFDAVRRRTLVAGLGLGAAAVGSDLAAAGPAASPASTSPWRPALEAADDWMDLPGRHRMVFDASTLDGATSAGGFAATFLSANKDGYGLAASDVAVIIILRHHATPFAYNDAVWAKYGDQLGKLLRYDDPKTKKPPVRNTQLTTDDKDPDAVAATFAGLAGNGVRFAVCGYATKGLSGLLAGDDKDKDKNKDKAEAIHKELLASLIPNAHIATAGILALNRAQERGYAVARLG